MNSLAKAVLAVTLLALVLAGVYFASQWNLRYGLIPAQAGTAAVVNALPTPGPAAVPAPVETKVVTITGTLTYDEQQGRTVPYLFYTNANGNTASKVLAFRDESICVTSIQAPCPGDLHALIDEYGSGRVTVTGILDDESLVVERISAAS